MRFLLITVKIALRALRRNAMRSLLTILGIIIGVAVVLSTIPSRTCLAISGGSTPP